MKETVKEYETFFFACAEMIQSKYIIVSAENKLFPINRKVLVIQLPTKLLSLGCPTQIPVT